MVDAFLFIASTIIFLINRVFLRLKIGGVVAFGYPLATQKNKNS